MTGLNESGMYALVFGSKLPAARAFKRWVTSEVLPAPERHKVRSTRSDQGAGRMGPQGD
ncbi:BRO family, N-terminal domain [Actinomadura meyerae]|uniref:BRO family, N-terminal domain n=2 Tax=Actinomadura meyerae TaxID=240840 RepID=A0A239JU09_9ACTN|nr:BRO family, N-terminal domain [Actinomadura meyerae]